MGRLLVALGVLAAIAVAGVATAPSGHAAEPFNASIDATIADIQSYWSATMPEVYGTRYDPIPSDRLIRYSRSNPPPACGGRGTTPYEEVAGNAFYCSEGDFVAWDAEELLPKLSKQFGPLAPALVLAHEWGHAIQARVGYQAQATVYMEQQADCFAGSWTAHVAHGGSDLHLAESDLDSALAGFLQLRDPSGVDGGQDGAHGNGFDRVRAFQDGFEGGAKSCADYQNDPPPVTETGYTSETDYLNGGNLSLDELLPAVQDSLSTYWSTTPKVVAYGAPNAPSCDGGTDGGVLSDAVTYCPATNTIAYDRATMQRADSQIGDFAAGVLLASEWSSAVQHGNGQSLDHAEARRTADCLAGAFTSSLDPDTSRSSSASGISLSPGDLDEVVSMLVAADSHDGNRGTAFNRVSAFRTGFFRGAGACS
ncbi:MAG TPA: neutral zinc metallopeptidase [Acidimicrobiia bacterium]